MRWACKQFHECLIDSPAAEGARRYLGERGLKGETVRRWELGYAPGSGQWLLERAEASNVSLRPLLLVTYTTAQAGPTFTVNTTADHDDGSCTVSDCTLREAVAAANAYGSPASVYVPTSRLQSTPSVPLANATNSHESRRVRA